MNIVRFIPNTLTSMNLVSGCVASTMALQGNLFWAMMWIIIASVFDFSDGLAARLLKAYSPLGKELDSLADVVSFGVAPGMILYTMLGEWTVAAGLEGGFSYLPYLAFVVPAFSGLRLAKFNNDSRQTTSFIGLPVPANALFWASLVTGGHDFLLTHLYMPVCLVPLICLFSWLLVSEIPMFSLKFKSLKWKDNKVSFTFLLVCIPLLALLGACSFAAIIVWYIILSLVAWKKA